MQHHSFHLMSFFRLGQQFSIHPVSSQWKTGSWFKCPWLLQRHTSPKIANGHKEIPQSRNFYLGPTEEPALCRKQGWPAWEVNRICHWLYRDASFAKTGLHEASKHCRLNLNLSLSLYKILNIIWAYGRSIFNIHVCVGLLLLSHS